MALSMLNRLCSSVLNCPKQAICAAYPIEYQQVRYRMNNKHRNPKFKVLRRLKTMTIDPIPKMKPMFVETEKLDFNYWHIKPPIQRMWNERDLYVSTTSQMIEEFVPPEDDASRSSILEKGKSVGKNVKDKSKDKLAVRKIRQYEAEFNIRTFPDEAKDIYIAAHDCLASGDEEKLNDYVTEMARTTMLKNTLDRTIHWKYLQSLEEPKIVQVRYVKMDGDDDIFAQITVRIHSQQMLAVYDRFGRLIYGSEMLAKDVLEYVVFEKHLSNEYGLWRVHAKIIPDCLIRPAEHTYIKSAEDDGPSASEAPIEAVQVQNEKSPQDVDLSK